MLSGPVLEAMKQEIIDWFTTTRTLLIDIMEQEQPFNSVKLTPQDQVERFLNMTPQDWQNELYRIGIRYHGLPNKDELVNTDVTDFLGYIRKHLEGAVANQPTGQQLGPLQ